jgi:energy-coupling factor transport system permease protein
MYLYIEADTFLHRLNPVTKILLLLLSFLLCMLFEHPLFLLPPLIALFFLLLYSKSLRNLKRALPILLPLFVLSVLLWSLFGKQPLYGVGAGMRISLMIGYGLLFLSCTRVEEFTWALERLHIPYKAAFALSLSFRLVPTLLEAASTVLEAQRARGLSMEGRNIVKRLLSYVPLLVPVFMLSLRRMHLLSFALELRGFGARKRTFYRTWRMRGSDLLLLLLLLLVDIICMYMRMKGVGSF